VKEKNIKTIVTNIGFDAEIFIIALQLFIATNDIDEVLADQSNYSKK